MHVGGGEKMNEGAHSFEEVGGLEGVGRVIVEVLLSC